MKKLPISVGDDGLYLDLDRLMHPVQALDDKLDEIDELVDELSNPENLFGLSEKEQADYDEEAVRHGTVLVGTKLRDAITGLVLSRQDMSPEERKTRASALKCQIDLDIDSCNGDDFITVVLPYAVAAALNEVLAGTSLPVEDDNRVDSLVVPDLRSEPPAEPAAPDS